MRDFDKVHVSLDKAIKHGKEKRRPYYNNRSCRPHGGCLWCLGNRMHKHNRRTPSLSGSGIVLHGPVEGYFADVEPEI